MQLRDNYKYAYISSATTTQVDTGPGELVRIIIGEDAAGAVSIIDNVSGSTVNIGQLEVSAPVGVYEFGVSYALGLRIITAGATKLTVVYAPRT